MIFRVIARRVIQLVAFLFSITSVVFVLIHLSGDPAAVLAGETGTQEQLAQIRQQYGLDQPFVIQYLEFLRHTFTLDFGDSFLSGQLATRTVLERVAPTLLLTGLAMLLNVVLSVLVGVWLGYLGRDSHIARATQSAIFVAQGIPYFVVSLLLIQLFAVKLDLLPSVGYSSPASWILPSFSLAWLLMPRLVRVVTVNIHDALREDYIRTARAFGARRLSVVFREALPNALLSSVALASTQLGFLLGGTLIIESVFSWPGLGQLLVDSAQATDMPVVVAAVFAIAVMVFVANLITDLLFKVLDPRLRTRWAER